HMFNTLTQHRWPFNSAVQGDKRCRYAAERHRAKTLATSSVTSKVNPGRQYQAAATRVLTSGQSSFDSVKPGIPFYTAHRSTRWCIWVATRRVMAGPPYESARNRQTKLTVTHQFSPWVRLLAWSWVAR